MADIIDIKEMRNRRLEKEKIKKSKDILKNGINHMRKMFSSISKGLEKVLEEINNRPPLSLIENNERPDESSYYKNRNSLTKQEMSELIRDCNNNLFTLKTMVENAAKKQK